MSYDDYENGKLDGYNEGYADGFADGKVACEKERAMADEKMALEVRLNSMEYKLSLIFSMLERPTKFNTLQWFPFGGSGATPGSGK